MLLVLMLVLGNVRDERGRGKGRLFSVLRDNGRRPDNGRRCGNDCHCTGSGEGRTLFLPFRLRRGQRVARSQRRKGVVILAAATPVLTLGVTLSMADPECERWPESERETVCDLLLLLLRGRMRQEGLWGSRRGYCPSLDLLDSFACCRHDRRGDLDGFLRLAG